MNIELTPIEQKIVTFIKDFKKKNGVLPYGSQIQKSIKMSRANFSFYMKSLIVKGVIKKVKIGQSSTPFDVV